MKFRINGSLTWIWLLILASGLEAQFHKLETSNLNLIYLGKPHEYIVPHLARTFENSLRFHSKLFDYIPSEKITVFLQDFSDYGNAGAMSVPRNIIEMRLAPANYVFETKPANERMNHTMNHELVHIVALDRASKTDKFFRKILEEK